MTFDIFKLYRESNEHEFSILLEQFSTVTLKEIIKKYEWDQNRKLYPYNYKKHAKMVKLIQIKIQRHMQRGSSFLH